MGAVRLAGGQVEGICVVWNLGHRAGHRLKGRKDAGCREGHMEASEQEEKGS